MSGESFSLPFTQICPQMSASVPKAEASCCGRPQKPSLSPWSFLQGPRACEDATPASGVPTLLSPQWAGPQAWGAGAHQNHVNQFPQISLVGFPRTHTRQEGLTTVQASHSPMPLCVSCLGRGGLLNESWASLCYLKTRSRVNGCQELSCFIGLTCGNVFF